MRRPLAALGERLARRRATPAGTTAPPRALPADMGRGAAEMQERLDGARTRLKEQIAPKPPEDDAGPP